MAVFQEPSSPAQMVAHTCRSNSSSAVKRACISISFSSMAVASIGLCRSFPFYGCATAANPPMHTVKPGSARQGQMPRSLQRKAVGGSWAAIGADKCDPSTQRPAAGTQIHEGAIHGAKH